MDRIHKYATLVLLLGILAVLLRREYVAREENREMVHAIDSIVSAHIAQRNHLDTLYWTHLEQCAFELREGLKPDKRN